MRDNKARMLGLIYLLFMAMVAVVYGFDIPEEPAIRIGSGAVQDARFSPDGRYLAVATSLGVEIRDADTREQLRFLPGASGPVVFNHQTTLLVTGAGTIWDTVDFTKIAELPEEQRVFAFTPDGKLLIAGHWRTAVSVWDTGNWQKVRTYSGKHNGDSIRGLSISPDGKLLCAAFSHPNPPPIQPDEVGNIIIWEVESGREIKVLVDDAASVSNVVFSPDGAILATHIGSDTVLWDTQTWRQAGRFRRSGGGGSCHGCVYSMEFQPGTRFLASPRGYFVQLWDTDVVAEVRELSGHAANIGSVSFHPNGNLLTTVSLDGDMKLWDVASGKEIEMTPYSSPVTALAFSQDSETLFYCGEKLRTERYNLVTGETESIIPAEGGIYDSMDFDANGSLLAVTGSRPMTIYSTDTGEVELSLDGRYDNAIFSHDGNTLVLLTRPAPGDVAVMLWDVRNQAVIVNIPLTWSGYSKAELGDDGKMLAVLANGGGIQIWDVAARRKESAFRNGSGGYRVNMALSNTGKLLAANGSFEHRMVVKVWDVDKGEILYILDKAKGAYTPFAFSPDDRILVTGAPNGEMALWDMKDGKMLHLYHEHTSRVSCLEFSPDGKYLASGGEDGLILIWEVNADRPGDVVGIEMADTALVKWGAVKRVVLFQNYPNPFNPDTWIPYRLAQDTRATITIYDSTGQTVRTLELGHRKAGHSIVHWNGKDDGGQSLASGIYFYVLKADDGFSETKKMALLR
ncbi:FlgD immunoglobulin-like domain containing protein [Candidatus Poribacteria bacterium]